MIQEGKKAPSFTLKDSNNQKYSLKDFQGKKVILYFYPKDDTTGCTKEALGFKEHKKEINDKGAIIIGVSPDSPESHQKFIEKYNLPFLLLSDPEKIVLNPYNAWGEKSMYGRKYMGVMRSTVIIDENGIIIKHFPKVSASKHLKEVLKFLNQ
jgi:thioredoxin-dependent peroxiredoxin